MLTAARRPLGNLLASALGGRGDLSADARLMGATQARVPVGSASDSMPGGRQMLASLLSEPDSLAPGPMPMVPGAPPSPGRGHLIASAFGGGSFPGAPNYGTPPFAPTFEERGANERAPMIGFGEMVDPASSNHMPLPDIGSGLPDVSTLPTHKPGFFDSNGGWRNAVGILGDALAGAVGRPPLYAQMQMQQRQQETEDKRAERRDVTRRQAERDEWTWRESYKRKNPDDQLTSYMVAAGMDPQSPEARRLYRQRAESMTAPPLMAIDGFDAQGNQTKTFMPRTGVGTGGQPQQAGPPPGTVRNGFRFTGGNPNDRTSWVPVGGASPDGGATFR